MEEFCTHMALQLSLLSDAIPNPTPISSCQRLPRMSYDVLADLCSNPVWYTNSFLCISCMKFYCGRSGNTYIIEHYKKSGHCLFMNYSDKVINCWTCYKTLNVLVFQQLCGKGQTGRSSSSKLEIIDAVLDDVNGILSKPFPSISVYRNLNAESCVDQDKVALAEEGLSTIFFCGLKSLADPKLREDFLLYTSTLLADESFPSDLKSRFSKFIGNLSEKSSVSIQVVDKFELASASITRKKFTAQKLTSEYDEVKNKIVASDEKVTNLKATIKEHETQIEKLKGCLATEESIRAKFDEAIDSIMNNVTIARDGQVSDVAQVSGMEESIQAGDELVAQMKLQWNLLELLFNMFRRQTGRN